ncbi:hypothetical protein [Catenuloplanes atrovinosus]|uniref:Uncharacterized protein n=1 Tax=Catenuloplanes atrovinosus TaxID=137266 RepID=A0AAE4CAJ0_9ACTN|nr:hypothetical protein [Catenuloplanes atrovinosus]MDR7277646.1 hypothetical protein [Catenuloplanes atrovinosus]
MGFEPDTIAAMVRATGAHCTVLTNTGDTATIAAGNPDPERYYPLLCRLGHNVLTPPSLLGDFRISPGHPGWHTPQDILKVGATTDRDIADLVIAYLIRQPHGAPWQLLDSDTLDDLGFDGTLRGLPRRTPNPTPGRIAVPHLIRALNTHGLTGTRWHSGGGCWVVAVGPRNQHGRFRALIGQVHLSDKADYIPLNDDAGAERHNDATTNDHIFFTNDDTATTAADKIARFLSAPGRCPDCGWPDNTGHFLECDHATN